ncbi:MAG: aminotransferase class V-fold PLP-dependent enzyme [Firmicutes bacterium]|nr:aminotransferase class V-fold PLP-dependent enzyme [Bacillota bacterium]
MHGYDLKLLIPAALNTTYLNSGTLGPTPSTALAAAAASELEWVEAGPGWHTHYANARRGVRQFAERVERHMPGGSVTITENNSQSLMRVFWGIRWEPDDEIITTDHEHGAVLQALSALMKQYGVKVRVVSVEGQTSFASQVRALMGDKTRLVVMSHVSYLTGWALPVADVAEIVAPFKRCRLLVDGAQALGNIVVNPEEVGADFYVFCGHKWMMAPAGWAGLWVRHGRLEEVGTRWPLEPDPLDAHLLEQAPFPDYSPEGDALEFGTRCWPRISGWSVTWDYFEEEGFPFHAQYQLALADQARERLRTVAGLSVQDPPTREYQRTAMMAVACRQLGSGLSDWLWERGVVAKASRGRHGIRLSWASFNTEDDLERLIDAMDGLDEKA